MTDKDVQDYRDAIRYLLRVYLVTTMTTCSEFARAVGLHHITTLNFYNDTKMTKLEHVNKIETYLRSKFENADALMQEGIVQKAMQVE